MLSARVGARADKFTRFGRKGGQTMVTIVLTVSAVIAITVEVTIRFQT
jgi:hypothetical protein